VPPRARASAAAASSAATYWRWRRRSSRDTPRPAHHPGATRYYRSAGEAARQTVDIRVDAGARLEWLPLETICHPGASAESTLRLHLAPGAETIGWDVLALGLPASGARLRARGRYRQEIEVPGAWLERGVIDGPIRGCSTPRSAWPDGACSRRCGSPRAAPSTTRAANRCWRPRAPRSPTMRLPAMRARRHLIHASSCCARWRSGSSRQWRCWLRVWSQWRLIAWDRAACPPRVWRT
jgi:urease accessory protein